MTDLERFKNRELTEEECRRHLVGMLGYGALTITMENADTCYRVDFSGEERAGSFVEIWMAMPVYGETINEAIDNFLVNAFGSDWVKFAQDSYKERIKINTKKEGWLGERIQETRILNGVLKLCLTGK